MSRFYKGDTGSELEYIMWQDEFRTISLNLEVHSLSTGHYQQDT
jgi:hypothetical protein